MATSAPAALVTCSAVVRVRDSSCQRLHQTCFFDIGFLLKSLPKPDDDERAQRNSIGRRQVSAERAANSSSPHPFLEQRQFGLVGAIVEFLLCR